MNDITLTNDALDKLARYFDTAQRVVSYESMVPFVEDAVFGQPDSVRDIVLAELEKMYRHGTPSARVYSVNLASRIRRRRRDTNPDAASNREALVSLIRAARVAR